MQRLLGGVRMKEFHPSGHVISESTGELYGMVLHQGKIKERDTKAFVVNNDAFVDLVRRDKVQLFEIGPDGNTPIVKYSPEEKKKYLRNKAELELVGKDYFDNDVCFSAEHILSGCNMVGSLLAVKFFKNLPFGFMAIYSNDTIPKEYLTSFKRSTMATLNKIANNLYSVYGNLYEIMKFIGHDRSIRFGINGKTALHDNILYRRKSIGMRNATPEEVMIILNTMKEVF